MEKKSPKPHFDHDTKDLPIMIFNRGFVISKIIVTTKFISTLHFW